jgi:hypothetical protein
MAGILVYLPMSSFPSTSRYGLAVWSAPNEGRKDIASSNVCIKGSRLQKLPTKWITTMIDYADLEGSNRQKETLGEPKAY